jgi:hypothetical protein
MEDKHEYVGTSSELHNKLEGVAESLGVSIVRDKAWPKSAGWLWRRIKEVLPVLVASGIVAKRGRNESAKQITLRKLPNNDGSDGSHRESRVDKGKAHADTNPDDGRSNGSDGANGSSNGSENPAKEAASANTADTANRFGEFSEEVSAFLREPPAWYRRQAEECARQGSPDRLLKPLASAVAYHLLGNPHRWSEVLPYVEAALKERGPA